MWIYEKKLQYPVKIKNPNARLASLIIDALGGPDGELGAATRYLNQRFTMPKGKIIATLTDIGNEELGHAEMVGSIIYQLTRNLTPEQITAGGLDKYYIGHGNGVFPCAASGEPFNATAISSKGDPLSDLNEDLAAEQKARVTYDNILRLSDDPDVNDVIKFLRQREIVHYQRFGDAIRVTQDHLDSKNFYAFNPSFDKGCGNGVFKGQN